MSTPLAYWITYRVIEHIMTNERVGAQDWEAWQSKIEQVVDGCLGNQNKVLQLVLESMQAANKWNPDREIALAITKLEESQMWLQKSRSGFKTGPKTPLAVEPHPDSTTDIPVG
jgi:hypothetical protein